MTTTNADTADLAGTLRPLPRARAAAAVPAPAAGARHDRGFQRGIWFVTPFLTLFALFVVWPLLRGVYLSFTDANISGDRASFIGLDNYREALGDQQMWDALGRSAFFTLLVVPGITVLAFLLAMLAHHIERGRWLWRLCFFMPFLLPSTVAANLWQWLFNPGNGLVNYAFHLDTPWLTDKSYTMPAVVVCTLWWTVGFSFLLYLAALQGIPAHLYEAAKLDGANAWHRMVHITLPMLRHITGLVVALQILASLQLFDQAVVMTDFGPGPENSTRAAVQYILEQGFTSYRVGYASAMSIIFFVIVAAVALGRMWLLRNREEAGR